MEPEFLTVDEVAAALRVSRWSVGRYIAAKELEAIKAPGRNGAVRISVRSYQAFIQRNTVTAQEQR
ncbi:helix-turn-helix domain-containing protein [Micromonosporaceae bacterium B7E4]